MREQQLPPHENPSDDLAAELDALLSSAGSGSPAADEGQGVVAGHVTMRQSTARAVKATAVDMDDSAAGMIRSGAVDARNGVIGWVLARQATLDNVSTSVVAATHIQAKELNAFAVFAARVDGQVNATITPWTAFAVGAGFAAALFLLRWLFSGGRKQ